MKTKKPISNQEKLRIFSRLQFDLLELIKKEQAKANKK